MHRRRSRFYELLLIVIAIGCWDAQAAMLINPFTHHSSPQRKKSDCRWDTHRAMWTNWGERVNRT